MIRVIVIEDHELFRTGLITLLEASGEITIVAEYSNGKEFLDSLDNYTLVESDIIFLDISMPWLSGLEVLQIIEDKGYNTPPICMLSMYPEQFYIEKVKNLGARGYINKDSGIEKLIETIRLIVRGGSSFSNQQDIKNKGDKPGGFLENLSSREIEVFKYLTQGMTVKEIAYELDVSIKTISTYKTRLMEKLSVDSLSDLLKIALMYEENQ